jgi:WD40 repeat protein
VLATARGATGTLGAAFSADGRHLATFEQGKPVQVWRVPDLRREAVLRVGPRAGYDAALSPDGRLAVTFGAGAPRLWDVAAQRSVRTLPAHTGSVASAAFSADGRFVVTGGEDGIARVALTATGRTVAVLSGHGDDLATVGFSPDGRRVVTAGRDGSALIHACPACIGDDELAALAKGVRP